MHARAVDMQLTLHIQQEKSGSVPHLDVLQMGEVPGNILVAEGGQTALGVVHKGEAAAHAGAKVLAGPAQDDNVAACHILQPVVAHALHHRIRAAVPHAESLRRHAREVRLALCIRLPLVSLLGP